MKIAGLILAGGQGQRMGGVNKGLQMYHGLSLVEQVATQLSPQVREVWVNANQDVDEYQKLGHPVFVDEASWSGAGPLAGIASFASYLPAEFTHIQIAPCDTPLIPPDLSARLSRHLKTLQAFAPNLRGVYPQCDEAAHYACALVMREHLEHALMCLQQGQHSLHHWLTAPRAIACTGFEHTQFVNLNTTEQLINIQNTQVTATQRTPHVGL